MNSPTSPGIENNNFFQCKKDDENGTTHKIAAFGKLLQRDMTRKKPVKQKLRTEECKYYLKFVSNTFLFTYTAGKIGSFEYIILNFTAKLSSFFLVIYRDANKNYSIFDLHKDSTVEYTKRLNITILFKLCTYRYDSIFLFFIILIIYLLEDNCEVLWSMINRLPY